MATRTASTHSKSSAKKPAAKSAPPPPKSTKTSAKAGPSSKHVAAKVKHDKHEKHEKHEKVAAKPAAKTAAHSREKERGETHNRADRATIAREEPMTLPKMAAAPISVPPSEERPSLVQTTMNKTQLARFRKLLEEKRDDIIKKAKQTLDEDMALDANDLPDEMDLASSEYLQSFTFRLRGREKSFLDKIDKALERIDNNTFGVCEECGEEISVKRLEARPETTLCIRCKEDQERAEKDYG